MNMMTPAPLGISPQIKMALWDAKGLARTRLIAAKECNQIEFDQFIHQARALLLDPLQRHIYAFVFNKTDPDKRAMSVIIGISGYRSIAARSGNYRPDDKAPRFSRKAALKGEANPEGIA